MPIRLAPEPAVLYRLGRSPDPLAWPPRIFVGGGRYDHPNGDFLTLYAAVQRRGMFLETLDAFRPAVADLAVAASLSAADPGDTTPAAGEIPDSYFRKLIGRIRVAPGQHWLDVRSPETHQALRSEMAETLVSLGYPSRFVWGDLLSHDHRLMQAIATWAYEREFAGIAYACCHDPAITCWAPFDRATFVGIGEPQRLDRDDPDLLNVARLFELSIPPAQETG